MDMGRILSIFNNMKNVNMSGTPASEEAAVAPETRNVVECSNCIGSGQIDLGWGETVPCRECQASGKIFENDRTVAYSGAEDEGPSGKYGAGQMWQKDEMDFPPESFFKTDIAGEKKHGEEANDHDLTVDDQLEQNGLEEAYEFTPREISMKRSQMEHEINWCREAIAKLEELLIKKPSKIKEINTLKRQIREKELKLAFDPSYGGEVKELPIERQYMDGLEESITEGSQKCVRCGVETVAPGIKFCDDCYKVVYDIAADRASKSTLKRRHTDLEESEMNITETAPPDQEAWVKANKARFKKEYGDKKGEEVLYATAWKNHNKKKKTNECDGCSNPEQERDSISINGSFNSENNEKSVTVTARNQKADELMQILQLSGLTPNAEPKAEIAPVPEPVPVTGLSAVVVGESTGDIRGRKCSECKKGTYQETTYHDDHDGVLHCNKCGHEVNVRGSVKEAFSEFPPELDDQESERNSMYCDQCGGYHSGNCPEEPTCSNCGEPRPVGINRRADAVELCPDCFKYGREDEYPDEYAGTSVMDESVNFSDPQAPESCEVCGDDFYKGVGLHRNGLCADCYRHAHEEDQFRTPEPDDFEEMNRNEADDYMNENYSSYMSCAKCGSWHDYYLPCKNAAMCKLCHENEAMKGSKFCSACASGEGDDVLESKLNESGGYYVQGQSKGTDRNRFKYRDCWVKLNPHRENSSDPDFIIVFGKQYATIFDDLGEAKKYAVNAKSIFNLHGVSVKPQMADVIQWPNKVQESKKVTNMNEALTPKREGTGLNGAPKTWQNEPNEQMAGWKALVQDTDGLSQPHDMFNAVKGSDNIMTVATKKKGEQEKPSGDFAANALALAEKLQKKFDMLEESDDSVERMTCCKCSKNTSRFNCRCGHKLCSSCKEAPANKKAVKEASLKEDFCVSCDKRIPTGSDIDQCKKCYAKDHPEEGKTKKKVAETVDNLGTSKKVCKICGKKAGSHTEAGEKKCLAALDKKEGKKKVAEAISPSTKIFDDILKIYGFHATLSNNAYMHYSNGTYRVSIYPARANRGMTPGVKWEIYAGKPGSPRLAHGSSLGELKNMLDSFFPQGPDEVTESSEVTCKHCDASIKKDTRTPATKSGWRHSIPTNFRHGTRETHEAEPKEVTESTASKVAKSKEDHPEKFCKTKKCLYRTDAEYCPKHKPTEKVKESTMKPSEVTEEVSKPQAKKLQGMLDSLGQKVAKLGAPPSAKTKITQSLERFTDKLAAMKDTLDKKKAASEPKKETEPEKEEKNAEEPMKGKKKEPAKNEKEGKEAEPKPKEQKETASDKPDTNGDDKAPKGKVKDIGKGIYESETERMQSLRNIITEGLE